MNLIGCLGFTEAPESTGLRGLVSDLMMNELAYIGTKEIGFVFQTFNLAARATALHNVELPLIYNGTPSEERIEKAKKALERVTDGPDEPKPNELSGGQRQRVACERALVNSPSIGSGGRTHGNLDRKRAKRSWRLSQTCTGRKHHHSL